MKNPLTMVLLYALLILGLIYFLAIVPGKKKNKKVREMHDSVAVGDEIVTVGGVIGRVVARDDEIVKIQIDPQGATMRILIYAVQLIKAKGDESAAAR